MSDRSEELKYEYRKLKLDFKRKKMELYEENSKRRVIIRAIFSGILTLIIIVSLVFLFTQEIPEDNSQLLGYIISGLTGAFFGTVMGYYFGDSDKHSDQVPSFEEFEKDIMENPSEED